MLFTPAAVQAIAARTYPFFTIETGTQGFALKVLPSGRRTFYFRQKTNHKRVDVPLGSDLELARARYAALVAREQQLREKHKAALAFATGTIYFAPAPKPELNAADEQIANPLYYPGINFELLKNRFIATHVEPNLRPATAKYYAYCLAKVSRELAQSRTLCGNLPLPDARAELKAYVHAIGLSTPTLANRIRETLSSMYKWAVLEDLCHASPIYGIRVFREQVRSRRFLQAELPAFFKVLNEGGYDKRTANCIRLILATGLRASEALRIRPEDVDLAGGKLLLPETKNGSSFLVPLVPLTAWLLEESMQGITPGRSIFRTSVFGLRQVVKRVAGKASVTSCSTHDLRRTFGTMLGELGVPIAIISRALNHTSGGNVTTRHYALHDQLEEKRAAVAKVAERLIALGCSGAPPAVAASTRDVESAEREQMGEKVVNLRA